MDIVGMWVRRKSDHLLDKCWCKSKKQNLRVLQEALVNRVVTLHMAPYTVRHHKYRHNFLCKHDGRICSDTFRDMAGTVHHKYDHAVPFCPFQDWLWVVFLVVHHLALYYICCGHKWFRMTSHKVGTHSCTESIRIRMKWDYINYLVR